MTKEQEGRRKAKHDKHLAESTLPIPKGLSPREARRWAEQSLDSLTPLAVQKLAALLTHGSRREQAQAAKDLLRGRSLLGEQPQSGAGGPVIVVTGLDPAALPWGGILKGRVVDTEKPALPAQSSQPEKP